MAATNLPEKVCAACGRRIVWRKKWERDWDNVRYCSDRCRKGGSAEVDQRLERTILELLSDRAGGATICPSEAARIVGGDDWHLLMESSRSAARRLVAAAAIEITQGGRVVDPSTARGPIRLRLRTREHRSREIARHRILAAPPMPVPDDPADLRAEIDSLLDDSPS